MHPEAAARHASPLNRRRIVIAGGAALAIAVAVVLALVLAGGASPVTIRGGMIVTDFNDQGLGCQLSGTGYSDISPGTQVVVSAPDGTVLGSGALGNPQSKVQGTICLFPFTVTGVKGGEARYGVTVSHRGTVWFSPQKIAGATLELGS